MSAPGLPDAPTFHFVIAEDDANFIGTIEDCFKPELLGWGLHKQGQFRFDPKKDLHYCKSVASFKKVVKPLLEAGHLVFATLDIIMPGKDGEVENANAGRQMVQWCLEQEAEHPDWHNRFEFCIVSSDAHAIADIFDDPSVARLLQKRPGNRKPKRICKDDLEASQAGMLKLKEVWPEIRAFIRKKITYGTFPNNLGHRIDRQSILLAPDEQLGRFFHLADKIAHQKNGGLFLLFADAAGYAEDWFRLCCHLRGIDNPHVLNFSEGKARFVPGWADVTQDMPQAVLLQRVDSARKNGFRLESSEFVDANFYRALAPEKLLFVQFPYFRTKGEVDQRLAPEEAKLLNACLERVFGQKTEFPDGIEFAFDTREHLIVFPSYGVLKAAGMIRHVIEFQAWEYQRLNKIADAPLDAEVIEVLCEIPWDDDAGASGQEGGGGLSRLREELDMAYESAAKDPNRVPGQPISASYFHRQSLLHVAFEGELGFRTRGKRFYQILNQPGPEFTLPDQERKDSPQARLAGLEKIHELMIGLGRLVDLHNSLLGRRIDPINTDFTSDRYQALKAAYDLIKRIFKDPVRLRKDIESFRNHMAADNWERHYPMLPQTEAWFDLLEGIKFTWPRDFLKVHWSISEYLKHSDVSPEILPDFDRLIQSHRDLKEDWKDINDKHKILVGKLTDRERQRQRAERYVREEHTQPAVVHLEPRAASHVHDPATFTRHLSSLLLFNAWLALCENKYVFKSLYRNTDHIRDVLESPMNGAFIGLLGNYLQALRKGHKLRESVFCHWGDDWLKQKGERRQTDALRLVHQLADKILDERRQSLSESQLDDLSKAAKDDGLSSIAFLNALNIIRNEFVRDPVPGFWEQFHADIYDLMRRFVAATTRDIRFGALADGGAKIRLWARHQFETFEFNQRVPHAGKNLWVFFGAEAPFTPAFPIDDLLCFHPETCSVFAYSNKKWADVSHTRGPDVKLIPGALNPWLPPPEHDPIKVFTTLEDEA